MRAEKAVETGKAENCIFCKLIAEGDLLKVYEDEWTVVFMARPGSMDGHMLAVPKKHVRSILDCDGNTLAHLMDTVQKVSRHLIDSCGYDGVNLLNASGESAGQSVPHFHIHILPRKQGDGLDVWPPLPGVSQNPEETWEFLRVTDA